MNTIIIVLFALISLLNPFFDISIGRCIDDAGNGKEYNGQRHIITHGVVGLKIQSKHHEEHK